ncbi:HD-GYP domain-containing protein [Bacillus spongiae]|uniref:HD-GYP domain-containing protein n=1 Tax=Bacillus spongiae TaxID=2683610 RepID=A0ABU8HGA8_9BACI
MKAAVANLETGCILAKDVMGLSSYPLLPKSTILTEQHIEVLQAFSIEDVHVESVKIDGTVFYQSPVTKTQVTQMNGKEKLTFIQHYFKVVQEYKKEFISWQSGSAINIAKIRNLFLPLFQDLEKEQHALYFLTHHSSKNEYVYHHGIAVGLLSGMIAKKLKYDQGSCIQVALAGVLSDCGMARVSPAILFKRTPLTAMEFNEIKLHTTNSYQMVKNTPFLKTEAKLAIYQHHERLDGSGYPRAERKDKIHPYSQIIAIADIYHAMTSEKNYRSKQSSFKVLEMIREDSFGKLNSVVVDSAIQLLANLPKGTNVRLSDGQEGEVLFTKKEEMTRPLIQTLKSGQIIDLTKMRDVYIESVIS